MTKESMSKAEAILMGLPQKVESEAECVEVLNYIFNYFRNCFETPVPTGEEVIKLANQFTSKHQVPKWVFVNQICGMYMIALPFSERIVTKTGKMIANGVFGYVYNIDAPDCSELGYTFYEEQNGKIKRLG